MRLGVLSESDERARDHVLYSSAVFLIIFRVFRVFRGGLNKAIISARFEPRQPLLSWFLFFCSGRRPGYDLGDLSDLCDLCG